MKIVHSKMQSRIANAWFALYTRSRHESKVCHRLTAEKIRAYLPVKEEIRQWHDRKKRVSAPLFPGYVFVRCMMDKNAYYNITQTPGVVRILGPGWPHFTEVPDRQISSIRLLLKKSRTVSVLSGLKEGEKVRIMSGALKGIEGVMVKKNPRQSSLIISVDCLNRSIEVKFNCEKTLIQRT